MRWRGFTIVELLIVVIIIAVLAAVAIPKYRDSVQMNKEAALKEQLAIVRKAMDRFQADTGYMVEDLGDLAKTRAQFEAESKNGMTSSGTNVAVPNGLFNGPYLDKAGMLYEPADRAFGGTTSTRYYLPKDPITGEQFDIYFSNRVVRIRSTSTGRGIDGILHRNY